MAIRLVSPRCQRPNQGWQQEIPLQHPNQGCQRELLLRRDSSFQSWQGAASWG